MKNYLPVVRTKSANPTALMRRAKDLVTYILSKMKTAFDMVSLTYLPRHIQSP